MTTIVATYSGTGNFVGSSDATKKLTVAKRATVTAAADKSSTYSEQTVDVTLTADVSATGSSVNAGSVTFQVKNGATNVGAAVTDSSVVAGAVSVTYTLPVGTAVGDYTIVATYSGTGNFVGSSDATKKLTVAKRATTVTTPSVSMILGTGSVGLSATIGAVPAASSTVNAGTVTFQLKNGLTNVGSAVTSAVVTSGAVSVVYALPAGTPVGSYTIVATYSGTGNFLPSNTTTATVLPVYRWDGFLQPINDTAHQTGSTRASSSWVRRFRSSSRSRTRPGTWSSRWVTRRSADRTTWVSATRCGPGDGPTSAPDTGRNTANGGQYLYGWSTKGTF